MRVGPTNVVVLKESGVQFPEVVATSSGKAYVVAEANQVFSVKIKLDDDAYHPGATHFRVTLEVDGKSVGMCRILSLIGNRSTVFEGFLLEGGAGSFKYAQFKFGKPSTSEDAGNVTGDPDKLLVGKIKIIVAPVTKTGSKQKDHVLKNQVGESFEELLRYETATILKLRNVLNPENPEHRRILGETVTPEAATPHQKRDKIPKQRQAVVKPEPASKVVRPKGATVLMDLTGDDNSRIKLENGRYLERDEFATCDLTSGVPSAKWEVHKKARVTID